MTEGKPHLGLPSGKALIALVAGGILLAVVIALRSPSKSGPALARSCATTAIALSSKATGSGRGIDYAITGPQSGIYVVAVDAQTVTIRGDGVVATPSGAFGAAIRQGLKGCSASGTLPDLAPGPHTVVLFRDGQLAASSHLTG